MTLTHLCDKLIRSVRASICNYFCFMKSPKNIFFIQYVSLDWRSQRLAAAGPLEEPMLTWRRRSTVPRAARKRECVSPLASTSAPVSHTNAIDPARTLDSPGILVMGDDHCCPAPMVRHSRRVEERAAAEGPRRPATPRPIGGRRRTARGLVASSSASVLPGARRFVGLPRVRG